MTTRAIGYTPEHLNEYTRPHSYAGATWEGWFSSGFGRSRESDALEESNFQVLCRELAPWLGEVDRGDGELWGRGDDDSQPEAVIIREYHYLVGWVEWVAIKPTAHAALAVADRLRGDYKCYPVLDESHYSDLEWERADYAWRECYSWRDRLAAISGRFSPRHQESPAGKFREMMAAVRGDLWAAYDLDAVELCLLAD